MIKVNRIPKMQSFHIKHLHLSEIMLCCAKFAVICLLSLLMSRIVCINSAKNALKIIIENTKKNVLNAEIRYFQEDIRDWI